MASLPVEVADVGIHSMPVEPGFFRTELLSAGSTTHALLHLASLDKPPSRFAAGADAVQAFEVQAHAQSELSTSLAHGDA